VSRDEKKKKDRNDNKSSLGAILHSERKELELMHFEDCVVEGKIEECSKPSKPPACLSERFSARSGAENEVKSIYKPNLLTSLLDRSFFDGLLLSLRRFLTPISSHGGGHALN
jgi:hypothetical protein